MERRERDLGRSREVQLVALDRVDVHLVRREETGAVHRLVANEHRRKHRDEALRDEPVEREAVERELEQRDVSDPVDEARARDARRALRVDPAVRLRELEMVARSECVLRQLADLAHDLGVVVGEAVGRVVGRRVGEEGQQLASPSLDGCVLVLDALQILLDACELLELLRRRLALQLRLRAQIGDARLELAPLRVDRDQLVEGVRGPLALECRRGSRPDRCVPRGCRSSRQECLNHLRDTFLLGRGTDEVRTRLHRGMRISDGDREPRPLDELDVVLAVAERDRPLAA